MSLILEITVLIIGANSVGPANVNLSFFKHSLYILIILSILLISGFSSKFKLKHIEASLLLDEFTMAPKPYTGNNWS